MTKVINESVEQLENLGIVEALFRSKQEYHDIYPYSFNVSSYDLERKDLFYGKLDKEGDIVFLDRQFLEGVEGSGDTTATVLDFVADAFFSFKVNFRKAARSMLGRDSVYYKDFKVHRSWNTEGIDAAYYNYMRSIYINFVDSYLSINRRYERVKNYRDFVREFATYCLKISSSFPITFSGFMSSIHCSPLASGLMLEVSSAPHGIENNKATIRYINDNHFNLWVRETSKFGFMVDRNAPWRLVFNIASGFNHSQQNPSDLRGAQLFLNNRGLSYENVFQYRFLKAYKYDMLFLKNAMETLYEGFYQQYSTYEEEEAQIDKSARCISKAVVFLRSRKNRDAPARFGGATNEDSEYWLKLLFKLKMSETGYKHDAYSYSKLAEKMIERKRLFGDEAAMKYINDLTKGFMVTKFNIKGGFWQGVAEKEFNERRVAALEGAENYASNSKPLTGTKNNKR